MNKSYWLDILGGFFALALQLLMFRHLSFWGIQPDAVLLYLIWLTSRQSRTTCIIMAAGTGLLADILLDTWGISMFSKTLVILLSYKILNSQIENILQTREVFVIVVLMSLLYFAVYFLMASFAGIYSLDLYFWRYWIGSSIYTAVLGSLFYMLRAE